jgi:dTDP-4-dehydrorhamnose reductase
MNSKHRKKKEPSSGGTEELPYEREPTMDPLPQPTGEPRKMVLVTGHKGQLGQALMELLQPDFRVAGVDLDEMDITVAEEVAGTFYLHQPDIVIHTAALTDVDGCELDPEMAIRVNGLGTQNLVIAAEEFNSVFVYLSTDYVFPGTATRPYFESDPTGPLSWYGRSKLLGEQYVRNMLLRYFIVRTSWLVGEKGRNFVKIMLKLAREKDELTVVKDQRGCPTFASDLAQAIRELVDTPYYGTYHVTNSGETTWYDFAVRILKEAGIDTPVRPITTEELGRPAPRPAYSVLSGVLFKERGFEPLRSWDEALVEYLSKIGERPSDI